MCVADDVMIETDGATILAHLSSSFGPVGKMLAALSQAHDAEVGALPFFIAAAALPHTALRALSSSPHSAATARRALCC